jgi:hypothetical protein
VQDIKPQPAHLVQNNPGCPVLFAARPRTEIVTLNPRIGHYQHDVNMTIGFKADKAKASSG